MASDLFLLIDGVKGESQAEGMTDYIELDSFSFGASNSPDVGGKGLSGGKASLSEFSCTFGVDQASYQVLKALYTGAHIKTCTFAARKTGSHDTPLIYMKVLMTNCYLSADSIGGGGSTASQSLSIAYEAIQYEYYTQDTSNGQVTLAGAATYDIAKSKQT